MSRKDWDSQYRELLKQQEEAEQAQEITNYVIAGRLSMFTAAKKAHEGGMEFSTFLSVMKTIMNYEVNEGQVNAETFEIPTDLTDIDDWLS